MVEDKDIKLSNDPSSAKQATCFFLDPETSKDVAFVQFPQMFHNLSNKDIYGSQSRRGLTMAMIMPQANLESTMYIESLRAIHGQQIVKKNIPRYVILQEAQAVASCSYDIDTNWGDEARVSKYSPFTYGISRMPIMHAFAFCYFTSTVQYAVAFTLYAFILPLSFFKGIPLFPMVKFNTTLALLLCYLAL
ncbi:Cellulose synthase-like protein G3, partial [Mucuna pruriens]